MTLKPPPQPDTNRCPNAATGGGSRVQRLLPGDVLLGALAILLLACSLGLVRNHLAARPLPLLAPWQPPPPVGVIAVSLEQGRGLLEEGAVFVDARERERYADGHVPGALSLPAEDFEALVPGRARNGLVSLLSLAPAVVVYCDGPECTASSRLARDLVEEGLRNVRLMPDGWPAWEAAGYPTVATPPGGAP